MALLAAKKDTDADAELRLLAERMSRLGYGSVAEVAAKLQRAVTDPVTKPLAKTGP